MVSTTSKRTTTSSMIVRSLRCHFILGLWVIQRRTLKGRGPRMVEQLRRITWSDDSRSALSTLIVP